MTDPISDFLTRIRNAASAGQQVVRITGEGAPTEWLAINKPQPDGSILNPMDASAASSLGAGTWAKVA